MPVISFNSDLRSEFSYSRALNCAISRQEFECSTREFFWERSRISLWGRQDARNLDNDEENLSILPKKKKQWWCVQIVSSQFILQGCVQLSKNRPTSRVFHWFRKLRAQVRVSSYYVTTLLVRSRAGCWRMLDKSVGLSIQEKLVKSEAFLPSL